MAPGVGIAGILDLGNGDGPGGAWEKLCADGARLFAEEDFKKAGEAYTDALSFISLSDRRARAAVLLNRAHAHIKVCQPLPGTAHHSSPLATTF